MELTTQPVLCCLGESVAGKPTQFVMERLFASAGLDWRAITVELQADEFEDAIAGIRAMKFQALRFFPSLQRRAVGALVPESDFVEFLGGVTSAMMENQQWIGWHNLGHGIYEEVKRLGDCDETVCWLHGDSARVRSTLAAICNADFASVVWSLPECENMQLPGSIADGHSNVKLVQPEELSGALSEAAELSNRVVLVTDEGSTEHLDLSIASSLQLFDTSLLVSDESAWKRISQLHAWNHFVSETDQVVSAEAYDFLRWTGLLADLSLLRDAYEEYCDF